MENKFTLLYVDDEISNLQIFKNTFRREYNIHTAISANEALKILDNEKVDLILSDQRMPETDGVTFLKTTIEKYPDINRILITAFTDFDALKSAINEAQIFQYVQKPWKEEQLRFVIEKALEAYWLKTENRRLTNQLKENNENLEKINNELISFDKLKSEFLSTISHEIRTPLNGLVGTIELIKHGLVVNDTRSIENIYFMLESSISKIEQFLLSAELITFLKAHKYPINITSIDISRIIEDTIKSLWDKAMDKNIDFVNIVSESTIIQADKKLISIILKEIIDNAIKYSPAKGKILIQLKNQDEFTVLEIQDQGSGFPEKVLKNAFKLFNKGGNVALDNVGISIAIAKIIMEEHSGDIKIQNIANSGALVQLLFKQ